MSNFTSWDQFYMTLVFATAMKSKDQSTQVGAVIVGSGHNIISMGYNGFPRGVHETEFRVQRPLKYIYSEHAERNAIYNNARVGGPALEGTTMYTQICPCADCARGIIQVGVVELIVSNHWDQILDLQPQWQDSLKHAKEMLDESGVKMRVYDGPILDKITNLCSGQDIKLVNP